MDATRIIKLDTQMFHDEFWKPFVRGSKGQGHESQKVPASVFALLLVLASYR